jgi:hypothetical protein
MQAFRGTIINALITVCCYFNCIELGTTRGALFISGGNSTHSLFLLPV